MANRSRRSGFAKKIDTVHWTYGSFETIALASAGVVAQNVLPAQHLPETLLRIRGEWAAALSAAAVSGVGAAVTIGLIQVPEGTGATVLWSPITDGDAPWIWWDTLNLIYREQVTDVNYSVMTSSGRRVIDSKAMRKIRNTEIQCVFEIGVYAGLTGVAADVVGAARFLAGS